MAKRRLSSNPTPIAVPADEVAATTTSSAGKAAVFDMMPGAASGGLTSPAPVATESKQARVIAMLRRPEGATIAELMAATGWMSHSVRGALSAVC